MNKKKSRELYILVVLLVIFAAYGFYSLLLSPKLAQAQELKDMVQAEDAIVRNMYTAVMQYTTDAATLQEKQAQTMDIAGGFYVRENQETYLDDLRQIMNASGVSYVEITAEQPSEPVLVDDTGAYGYVSPYQPYLADTATTDGATSSSEILQALEERRGEMPVVDQMQISFTATGSYSAFRNLIGQLELWGKHILCSGMEMTVTSDTPTAMGADPQVEATLTLQFLRLVDLDCLNQEQFPELPEGFVMPEQFVTGDYQNAFFLFLK